jgi:hypothetical protein
MKTQILLKLSLVLLVPFVLLGCTTTKYQPPAVKATDYPATNKIRLAVELRVADEFRNTEWIRIDSALITKNTHHERIGDALALNAEDCARAVFEKVISTGQPANAPVAAGAQALLVPRVVKFNVAHPELYTTVVAYDLGLEWTLYDSKGASVWSKEIAAVTRDKRWGWKSPADTAYANLFADLFRESFAALISAPEIHALAAK